MVHYCQRVTNAQRAAVCALILIGQPFGKSCRIVGAPHRNVRALLPKDWTDTRAKPRRWLGDGLRDIEAVYRDAKVPITTISAVYGISRRTVYHLAVKHGWPLRTRGKGPPLPVSYTKMPPEQLNRYRKLLRIIGRSAAEQAVFGS